MISSRFAKALRMAAPAAILILLPGVAFAEVCDKAASLNLANHLPALDAWLSGMQDGDQIRKFFTPEAWITGAILIWVIASGNSTRPTLVALGWFLLLAAWQAFTYLSIDLADPYYQAAITEGCVENSPRKVLSNIGFAVIAGMLTWQRIRRKAG